MYLEYDICSLWNMIKELPYYSREQLALRNGTDKKEVWICYQGYIYDVSNSRLWKSGNHYEHWAGQDLTEELSEAPHTENVFDKFQAIGKLSKV